MSDAAENVRATHQAFAAAVSHEARVGEGLTGHIEEAAAEFEAALDALVADLERERARADQAEAALEPFTHYDFAAAQWIAGLMHEGHELRALWAEDVEALKGHVARARAALSAGSGGREATP